MLLNNKLKIGDVAPKFEAITDSGEKISLNDITQNIVLYFYPKDHTPGCTVEAKEFAKLYEEYLKLDTLIIGVSKDNITSHSKFKIKCSLPFILISDENNTICEHYDSWGQKSFMGRKYFGVLRKTYLIEKNKLIKHIWPEVKPKNHATEVLDFIKKPS